MDVSSHVEVTKAIGNVAKQSGPLDYFINNASLTLKASTAFPDLNIEDMVIMTATNVHRYLFATYAVLNEGGMRGRELGTILSVTSTTALEVPQLPGGHIYHASKGFQEGFIVALRAELAEPNIKVLALRHGVVGTHLHEHRVGLLHKGRVCVRVIC